MAKTKELLQSNLEDDIEIFGANHIVYADFDEVTDELTDYDFLPGEEFSEAMTLADLLKGLKEAEEKAELRIPLREEVPEELTWDLKNLYESTAAADANRERIPDLTEQIKAYEGKLKNADAIDACLQLVSKLYVIIDHVSTYWELAVSANYLDMEARQGSAAAAEVISCAEKELTFLEAELSEAPERLLKETMEKTPDHLAYLKKLLVKKPHRLHPEAERTLRALGTTLELPYQIYQVSKLADMTFEPFEAGSRSYPLGYSLFEDDYEYDERTEVRRAAFDAFSATLKKYRSTTATAYIGQVRKEKQMADLHGFDSVFDYLLEEEQVPKEIYDRHIDLILEHLAPHMRKYAALLKKVHHLDTMTYADLKLTVDPGYDPKVTIGDSKKYITEGLAVLGQEYTDMIRVAYEKRWVDFAKNQGKSTGGFCASPYKKSSFILLNWNQRMSDCFTLAHEFGHAGHFNFCNQSQSFMNTRYSSYFIECPSTTNELLMAFHLLETNTDPRFRRWVLSSMIGQTYYHNFVTHLLEAAYQREVYRKVDAGVGLSEEQLDAIMRKVLEDFWGDAVEVIEGAELTWMRQPHYYMGLYSYTYSAGLTVGTQVAGRIRKEGETAVRDWIEVLKAGGTKTPLELAAMAGVDMRDPAPLLDTIDYIGQLIDEICSLTEELGF